MDQVYQHMILIIEYDKYGMQQELLTIVSIVVVVFTILLVSVYLR